MKKGIIILGAGPMQVPAIKIAKELDLLVIGVDQNPQAEGFALADVCLAVDIKDYVTLSQWASEHRQEYCISAVFVGADVAVTASAINEQLGLNGIPFKIALATHNKALMKEKWMKDGIPTPYSIEVESFTQAIKAAAKIGYPVIVKPTDNSASRGTKVVEGPAELLSAVENAKLYSTTGTCLIEEFVAGEEQSVETVMSNGRQLRAGIVDRHFGFFPYCVETGHTNPTYLPFNVQESIYTVVERAALSLGIWSGPAKADMILTKKGPMILEMAARLSGGFHSQYTTPLALGMNPIRAVIRQSLGDDGFQEDLQATKNRFAMCQALFPPPGKIRRIIGYQDALCIDGVNKIFLFKREGDTIFDYRNCADRPCYVIMSAETRKDLQYVFNKVCNTLKFEMGEVDETTGTLQR